MKRRMETSVIGVKPFHWRIEIAEVIKPTRWKPDEHGFFTQAPVL